MLKYLMIISFVRHVEISQTENDFITAVAVLNCKAVVYVFIFIKAAVCYFCLLIIVLTALMSSAM